jgi:hypothetical protein
MKTVNTRQATGPNRVFAIFASLLIMLVTLSGCGINLGLSTNTENAVNDALNTLDDAISTLDNASADWQKVLQDTVAKLTDDAQSTVRNEVTNVMNRGIAAVGGEFRCDVDFLRVRVRQDLMRIRAKLLGLAVEPAEPTFCSVVPQFVDMSLEPNRRNIITLFGYDFDAAPPMQVLLDNGTGTVDVSNKLDRQTHYHMTLNLGANGVPVTRASQKLLLKWQSRDISVIPIVQPSMPKCQTAVVRAPVGSHTYIPPRTQGDREFKGHGPRVNVTVRLENRGTHVEATVAMSALEVKDNGTTVAGDGTRAGGSQTITIYTAPPGQRIKRVIGTLEDGVRYVDTDHANDTFERTAAGPVKRFVVTGDTEGDDAGVDTGVKVDFNPLQLELVQTQNCVP